MKFRYVVVGLLLLLCVGAVQADWLTGWDYRKSVHINGSVTGDVSNYQMMVSVYNTTGGDSGSSVYLGTKAADDTWLSDIRFTGSDGTTLIDIWNESYYADHGDVWIACPTIDDSAGWDGFLYYGRTGASEVWDGHGTFPLLWDGFDGSSINTTTWAISGSPSVANSIATFSDPATTEGLQSNKNDFGVNTSYRARFTWNTSVFAVDYLRKTADSSQYDGYTSTYYVTKEAGVATQTYIINNGWHIWELKRNTTTSVIFDIDNVNSATHTTNLMVSPGHIRFVTVATGEILVDWYLVRSYQYPEPAISTWGAEEAAPCTAAFSGTPTTGNTPLTVAFTDASTTEAGTISTWEWVFGDGATSTEQNPSHTYTTSGTYTVNLTVTNSFGNTDSEVKTNYITVTTPGAPTAAFSGDPVTGEQPLEVSFTDTSTGGPTSWNWSFGDGEYSTWQHPIHTYTGAGTYNVSLNATNAYGSDTETKLAYITVTAVTPTPTTTPGNITEGNITYIWGEEQDYVPLPIWLSVVIVTIALFGHSIIFTRMTDVTATMACVFAWVLAWLSNMIGYYDLAITTVGTEVMVSPTIKVVHPPWLPWVMVMFALVACLNIIWQIWRVYIKPKPWNQIIHSQFNNNERY